MATPLTASRLVSVLRAEGLTVVEYRSWRTHNRNQVGAWGPVHGVMIHHTVTSGTQRSVDICYDGYSSLPGPLCLGVIAKDGTVYLVGYGRANHAGSGDDDVLTAVINERDLPEPNENNTDGNARFYGFECINLGDGKDPWPEAQLEAIERASAAICRAHGWSEQSVIGHKEWTNTKVDPRGFSMDTMRGRIGARLDGIPEEDDPMAGMSDQDIVKAVWLTDGVVGVPEDWSPGNAEWMPASILIDVAKRVRSLQGTVTAQGEAIKGLAAALAAHHEEIDADALVARISAKMTAALEGLDIRLDVTP